MANNKELEAGLKAMKEDFDLPGGGRKKLSQLVAGHLRWFDAAQRRGMGWRDVIRALTAAGVTGKGGKPLSVGTLSSTVWRKRAEAEEAMDRAGQQGQLASPKPALLHSTLPKEAKRLAAGQPPRSKHAGFQVGKPLQTDGGASTPSKIPANEPWAQNKAVLAFMNRARARRRQTE